MVVLKVELRNFWSLFKFEIYPTLTKVRIWCHRKLLKITPDMMVLRLFTKPKIYRSTRTKTLAQKLQNHGCEITDEMLYATIHDDVATNSEAYVPENVSQALHLKAERSNDEDDSECEVELVTSTETFKAINLLRIFYTNSEATHEQIMTVRDMAKVLLTISNRKKAILHLTVFLIKCTLYR